MCQHADPWPEREDLALCRLRMGVILAVCAVSRCFAFGLLRELGFRVGRSCLPVLRWTDSNVRYPCVVLVVLGRGTRFGRAVRCGDDTSDQALSVLVVSLPSTGFRGWLVFLFLTPPLGRQQCMLYLADMGERSTVACCRGLRKARRSTGACRSCRRGTLLTETSSLTEC